MNATWQMMANALTSFTQASLDYVIEHTTRSGQTRRFTRQWVIWHVIEHDLHHGGELSLLLGTHGLTGISIESLLQTRHGEVVECGYVDFRLRATRIAAWHHATPTAPRRATQGDTTHG